MLRNSIRVVIFAIVAIAGDQIGGAALNALVGTSGQRFPSIYRGELQADVVVLGNSRGIHMFHPPALEETFGIKFVNLAFNDLPPEMMPLLWKDYLKSHPAPKRLILEVSAVGVRDIPGSLERFTFLIDRNPEIRSLVADEKPLHAGLTRLSRLFRYNSPLTWRSLLFLGKSDQAWIMSSQLNDEMLTKAIQESDAEMRFDEHRAVALAEVIRLAREHRVEVACVLAPYEPRYAKRLVQKDDWLAWLETKLGQPIQDLSEALPDSTLFADHLHLHEAGAAVFAQQLESSRWLGAEEW